MTKNKKIGIALVIIPLILLIGSLVSYSVTSFIIANQHTTVSPSDVSDTGLVKNIPATTTLNILRMVLGLFGLFGVLGMLTMVPAGIYFLNKKNLEEEAKDLELLQTNEKYKNLSIEQIKFICNWSMGAFFGQPIWSFGNKLYLWGLGSFIPLFNIYVWIKVCISGRQMAWEKGGWKSFEQFKKRQTIVAWIIVAIVILSVVNEMASFR